jgi:predicted component of type VI protein secretion system
MTLSLSVIGYAGLPPAQPLEVTLGEAGGVIGRQPGCDWVLEDPEGHVSKRHCRIDFVAGQYRITDTSTNGVFLTDSTSRIGFGVATNLQDGDRIFIGSYVIAVRIASDDAPRPGGDETAGDEVAEIPTEPDMPEIGEARAIDLLQAFLEGAGLSTELLARAEPEAVLFAAGQRLRTLVGGLRALLATDIPFERLSDDPLRRWSDDEQALLALLTGSPEETAAPDIMIRHSFDELAAYYRHLRIEADRAAADVLARLDPDVLMARVEGQTLLAAFKKAKGWDLFQAEFSRLRAGEAAASYDVGNFIPS